MLLLRASQHRSLLLHEIEYPLINPLNKHLIGFELGDPGLTFLFELSQGDLSFLSSGAVLILVFGDYLLERIHLVLNRLLLRIDLLQGLIFVVDKFLGFFI